MWRWRDTEEPVINCPALRRGSRVLLDRGERHLVVAERGSAARQLLRVQPPGEALDACSRPLEQVIAAVRELLASGGGGGGGRGAGEGGRHVGAAGYTAAWCRVAPVGVSAPLARISACRPTLCALLLASAGHTGSAHALDQQPRWPSACATGSATMPWCCRLGSWSTHGPGLRTPLEWRRVHDSVKGAHVPTLYQLTTGTRSAPFLLRRLQAEALPRGGTVDGRDGQGRTAKVRGAGRACARFGGRSR